MNLSSLLSRALAALGQIAQMEHLPIGDQHEEMTSRLQAARIASAALSEIATGEVVSHVGYPADPAPVKAEARDDLTPPTEPFSPAALVELEDAGGAPC